MAAIRAAACAPNAKLRRLPWALLPLIAPFNQTIRETIEMRPFWQHPLRLDNRPLVEFLGSEPHTPLTDALRTTLSDLGSTNGTTVNGTPVQTWQLADGDTIRVGHSALLFRAQG